MSGDLSRLERFFAFLGELLAGDFADVPFTGHRGGRPLAARLAPTPARYLRLRLPGYGCLHLESIVVHTGSPQARVNLSAGARLTMSSVFAGTEHWVAERQWTLAENATMAIHTDWGDDQWICLEFDGLPSITEVVVHNRDDRWLSRAWGLVLETSTDGQSWQVVYSHAARVRELTSRLAAWARALPPSQEVLCMLRVCQIIARLFAQDFVDAKERLASEPRLPEQVQSLIQREISRVVLASSEFEWNSHGIVRPFKYWAEEERVEYLAQAAMLARDLSGLSPNVCLGFGLVLGLVREGDFIPHDDDIDLLIAFDANDCPAIAAAIGRITQYLTPLGYELSGDHFNHRWVRHASWPGAFPPIDVFVGLQEGARVSWYPSERRNLLMKDVFPPGAAMLHGMECAVPANILKYLDVTYGAHWRKVDQQFGHPWDTSQYSDIA